MSRPEDDERLEPPSRTEVAAQASRRTVQVEFGAKSHIGKVRDQNQDHFVITKMGRALEIVETNIPDSELPRLDEEFGYGMVVADGMGGMAAGEKASLLAIRTGLKLVFESPRWALKIDDNEARLLIERMKKYFQQVDETLIRETHGNPRLVGMGTTLTVAYSVGVNAFIVHAGDSRVYLCRAGRMLQLTRDHTLPGSPNVLTNFAGGPFPGITPEISMVALADGDRLLVCSDGLTKMVQDPEIVEILQRIEAPQAAVEALVQRALERGGKDNVTVLLAKYAIPVPITIPDTAAGLG